MNQPPMGREHEEVIGRHVKPRGRAMAAVRRAVAASGSAPDVNGNFWLSAGVS